MTTRPHRPGNVQIGDWLLESELHQLTGPERNVHLEPRATAVLLELAQHAGSVRTREELLDAVWGDAFVGEAALTHCIWELRKAFGDDAKNPSFIQTVPRRGYRLVASVEQQPTVAVMALVAWTALSTTGTVPSRTDPWLSELLRQHNGERVAVATARDGSPAEVEVAMFERPIQALRFALDTQATSAQGDERETPIPTFAVGVHLDEVEVREGPFAAADTPRRRHAAGAAMPVVLALCASARERQTLVSRSVFDVGRAAAETISSTQSTLRWLAHGDYAWGDHGEPLEVFEVGLDGFAPLEAPAGSASMRPLGIERTVLGWRPAPGQTVPQRPHWQLRNKLGEGGFGEVWLTEHAKTGDRRVFKFCVELDRLRALQREVTLFRLLKESLGSRRDITRILDWNFDQAPYFLELEYVEGGSFSDWAADRGGLEQIPLAIRLEIVAQAGEALAAAHSIGILHKDVKPGNILIGPGRDEQPRVLLTDFGIGRLADLSQLADADITALGLTDAATPSTPYAESGTRLYIAPELLEGKLASIQSDIYALGVVLYQTVVGRFNRAMGPGWRRNIDDPLLRDDIARCVDLAPEHRPQSAREVAERLRALESRRENLAKKRRRRAEAEVTRLALKRSQRRRRLLASVAGVALAVTAVVTVLSVLAIKARGKAEQSRERAEGLVSFMLGDLRGTLEGVGRLDAMESTNEEVLRYYDSLAVEEMTDEALSRRASALRQIGEVRLAQGALQAATGAFEASLRSTKHLVARDPSSDAWQAGLADSHFWLGEVLRRQGDLAGTREAFAQHHAIYQHLVANDPSQQSWQLELAYGHGNLGLVLIDLNEHDAALEHMRARFAIIGRLVTGKPDDQALQLALASSHHLVGKALERRGDLAGALDHYQNDHAILHDLATVAPDDMRLQERLATGIGYVGLAHWLQGSAKAARPAYETEVSIFERLCAIDPENARWQSNRAIAIAKVGLTFETVGDTDGALERYRSARDIFERLVAKNPSLGEWRYGLASRLRLLASVLLARGDTSQAQVRAGEARELLLSVLAEDADNAPTKQRLSMVEVLRGEALLRSGDPAAAQDAWEDALVYIEPLARDSDTLRYLDPWARALIALGRRQAAQPILDRLRARGYRAPDFVAFCQRFGVSV